MNITFTKDISDQRIQDLLTNAFEGGSNYWYHDLAPVYLEGQTKKSLGIEFWHIELPFKGGYLTVQAEPDADDKTETYTINLDTIRKGLQVMAKDYPRHWSDFVEENDDAITGDVFLQCVLFGKVIFG